MAGPREPSMEDILASIKRVIAEEKEIRTSAAASPTIVEPAEEEGEDDVLELDDMVAEEDQPVVDLGPPLMEEEVADTSRHALQQLASVAASAPPQPQVNPLEDMLRDMLRPVLKEWLDQNLPRIVDEHVKREIHRITGRPV